MMNRVPTFKYISGGGQALTTALAKGWVRQDDSSDDTLIDTIAVAAQSALEAYTNRTLISSVWDMFLDNYPEGGRDVRMVSDLKRSRGIGNVIWIPRCPVTAVAGVYTTDDDALESTQDTDTYYLDLDCEPARVILIEGNTWGTMRHLKSMRVRFTAGYASAGVMPEALRQALKFTVGAWYDDREAMGKGELPPAAKLAANPYRVLSL
jgi:uncharacterized phiE125 gp8 family phage protein